MALGVGPNFFIGSAISSPVGGSTAPPREGGGGGRRQLRRSADSAGASLAVADQVVLPRDVGMRYHLASRDAAACRVPATKMGWGGKDLVGGVPSTQGSDCCPGAFSSVRIARMTSAGVVTLAPVSFR